MAGRKRITNETPKKKWGKNRPFEITINRQDGTSYTKYRVAYYVEVLEGDDWLTKRRYADSIESPEAASRLAAQREAENEEYWTAKRGTPAEAMDETTVEPPLESRNATLTQAAEEMLGVSRRWRGGKLTQLSHSYTRRVRRYIRILEASRFSMRTLRAIQSVEVQTWFNGVCEGYAPSTAKNLRGWLIALGDFAQHNEYWDKNLFKNTTKVTIDTTVQAKGLTLDEIDAIWNAAHTPQFKAALVLLRLGLRQGEVLGLTQDDLIDDDTIMVSHTLGERPNPAFREGRPCPNNENYLGHTKTVRSKSAIHVPKEWMKLLRDSLALAQACPIADPTLGPGEYRVRRFVVSNRFGMAWHEGSASAAMRKLLERADVHRGKHEATWHCWRHAFASDLVALGADDIALIRLMRHSDPSMSRGVYADARDEHRARYREYALGIQKLGDYTEAIYRFDADRRRMKADGAWN